MNSHLAYTIVLAGCIFGPLMVQIFFKKFRLHSSEQVALLKAVFLIAVPFIIIDSLSHDRGWWSYSAAYITGVCLFGLPIEELAFFFVIPYCCIYLYVMLCRFIPPHEKFSVSAKLLAFLGIAATLIVMMAEPKERSIFDALLMTTVLLIAITTAKNHTISVPHLTWIGLIAGLFLLVNGILTSWPIVQYNTAYGSTLRLGSIPVADAMYNVSLLVSVLMTYVYLQKKADRAI